MAARKDQRFESAYAADFSEATAARQRPSRSIDDLTRENAEALARHPFRLAPMAGITDAVYRGIFRENGCPLAYTEMVSVAGLAHDSAKTWDLIFPSPQEDRVAVQLFGSRPEQFGPAADNVCSRLGDRLELIDINMACPVPKVFKKGEGCALMGRPDIAARIVRETLSGIAGRVPLTVKIRLGVRSDELLAPDFARMLEQEGVSCVAVHGRFAGQLYRGIADWNRIDEVARCVGIPVIGSGDVMSPAVAVKRLTTAAVSGVFVARGSYGTPWFFSHAQALLESGKEPAEPSVTERLDFLRMHISRYAAVGRHMARLRPMVGWYVKGLPAASVWRNRAMACSSEKDYLDLVDQMQAACIEHGMA
jgi:tRNA-dihydrouridine synthase B